MEMEVTENPETDGLTDVLVIGPANTSITLYDGDPDLMTTSYIRGLSLVAAVKNGVRTYYHYNAHGDVVQLTNSSGTVTKDYTYDAFGVDLTGGGSDLNPFRYCGEQYDDETGNYYLQTRYYSPAIGRFTQEDTHWNSSNMVYGDDPQKWNTWQGEKDTLNLHAYTYKPAATAVAQAGNLYGYGLSNPVYFVDRSGKNAQAILEGGLSTAVVVSQLDTPAPGPADVVALVIAGGTLIVAGGVAAYNWFAHRPPSLPSWKKVKVNMPHIMSGHSARGNRGPNKDRFPKWMTETAILKAIEEAYKHAEKAGELKYVWQDGVEYTKQFFYGNWSGGTIEFWFNYTTKTIETAWPK